MAKKSDRFRTDYNMALKVDEFARLTDIVIDAEPAEREAVNSALATAIVSATEICPARFFTFASMRL